MAIVFQVNLSTVNRDASKQPYDFIGQDYTNLPSTRITWFPGFLLDNRELRHGDTFTVSGKQAVYLNTNFTSGTYKFLDVVSGTALGA